MTAEQRPARRPGGRRPIPPLIFLLVLAILALGVWWKVIHKNEKASSTPAACSSSASPDVVAKLATVSTIKVHVQNGSSQAGLAAAIGTELTGRGFTVLDIGNAPGNAEITTAGQIQYGPKGDFAAAVLSHEMMGFELVMIKSIADDSVTVVAGQAYQGMTDPTKAAALVKLEAERQGKIQAGCSSAALPPVNPPASSPSAAPSSPAPNS
ncbi:MAG: LytR C-terminal domain-containing protein [Antricoccus sp.]